MKIGEMKIQIEENEYKIERLLEEKAKLSEKLYDPKKRRILTVATIASLSLFMVFGIAGVVSGIVAFINSGTVAKSILGISLAVTGASYIAGSICENKVSKQIFVERNIENIDQRVRITRDKNAELHEQIHSLEQSKIDDRIHTVETKVINDMPIQDKKQSKDKNVSRR